MEQLSIEGILATHITGMVMAQLRPMLEEMARDVKKVADIVGASDEKWLKAGEAAELLGCDYETLRRWGDNEGLPFIPSGTQRVYPRSSVLAWMRQPRGERLVAKVATMRSDRERSGLRKTQQARRRAKWLQTSNN